MVDTYRCGSVTLAPLAASVEGRRIALGLGEQTVTLQDVVVGEVRICGGQNDVGWTVRRACDADLQIACAEDARLLADALPVPARQPGFARTFDDHMVLQQQQQ